MATPERALPQRKGIHIEHPIKLARNLVIALAVAGGIVFAIGEVQKAVNNSSSKPPTEEPIGNNTLPIIPEQPPLTVPTVEIPEITVPKSFTTTTETTGNVTITTGTILEGVNTTRLTRDNLSSVVESNPDYFSQEWSPYVMTDKKHIFIAVDSDKPVVVENSIRKSEVYHLEDDGSRRLVQFVEPGGIRLTFEGTGVLKLFTQNPVEVFQGAPLIYKGEKYLQDFYVVETAPNGKKIVYYFQLIGDARIAKLSDRFANAPEVSHKDNMYKAENGIRGQMSIDGNGNITSPPLLDILKPGAQISIVIYGNTKLELYTMVDKNGDTKVVKPS